MKLDLQWLVIQQNNMNEQHPVTERFYGARYNIASSHDYKFCSPCHLCNIWEIYIAFYHSHLCETVRPYTTPIVFLNVLASVLHDSLSTYTDPEFFNLFFTDHILIVGIKCHAWYMGCIWVMVGGEQVMSGVNGIKSVYIWCTIDPYETRLYFTYK